MEHWDDYEKFKHMFKQNGALYQYYDNIDGTVGDIVVLDKKKVSTNGKDVKREDNLISANNILVSIKNITHTAFTCEIINVLSGSSTSGDEELRNKKVQNSDSVKSLIETQEELVTKEYADANYKGCGGSTKWGDITGELYDQYDNIFEIIKRTYLKQDSELTVSALHDGFRTDDWALNAIDILDMQNIGEIIFNIITDTDDEPNWKVTINTSPKYMKLEISGQPNAYVFIEDGKLTTFGLDMPIIGLPRGVVQAVKGAGNLYTVHAIKRSADNYLTQRDLVAGSNITIDYQGANRTVINATGTISEGVYWGNILGELSSQQDLMEFFLRRVGFKADYDIKKIKLEAGDSYRDVYLNLYELTTDDGFEHTELTYTNNNDETVSVVFEVVDGRIIKGSYQIGASVSIDFIYNYKPNNGFDYLFSLGDMNNVNFNAGRVSGWKKVSYDEEIEELHDITGELKYLNTPADSLVDAINGIEDKGSGLKSFFFYDNLRYTQVEEENVIHFNDNPPLWSDNNIGTNITINDISKGDRVHDKQGVEAIVTDVYIGANEIALRNINGISGSAPTKSLRSFSFNGSFTHQELQDRAIIGFYFSKYSSITDDITGDTVLPTNELRGCRVRDNQGQEGVILTVQSDKDSVLLYKLNSTFDNGTRLYKTNKVFTNVEIGETNTINFGSPAEGFYSTTTGELISSLLLLYTGDIVVDPNGVVAYISGIPSQYVIATVISSNADSSSSNWGSITGNVYDQKDLYIGTGKEDVEISLVDLMARKAEVIKSGIDENVNMHNLLIDFSKVIFVDNQDNIVNATITFTHTYGTSSTYTMFVTSSMGIKNVSWTKNNGDPMEIIINNQLQDPFKGSPIADMTDYQIAITGNRNFGQSVANACIINRIDLRDVNEKIGELSDLTTNDKSSIVNSINSIIANSGSRVSTWEYFSAFADGDINTSFDIDNPMFLQNDLDGATPWTSIVKGDIVHDENGSIAVVTIVGSTKVNLKLIARIENSEFSSAIYNGSFNAFAGEEFAYDVSSFDNPVWVGTFVTDQVGQLGMCTALLTGGQRSIKMITNHKTVSWYTVLGSGIKFPPVGQSISITDNDIRNDYAGLNDDYALDNELVFDEYGSIGYITRTGGISLNVETITYIDTSASHKHFSCDGEFIDPGFIVGSLLYIETQNLSNIYENEEDEQVDDQHFAVGDVIDIHDSYSGFITAISKDGNGRINQIRIRITEDNTSAEPTPPPVYAMIESVTIQREPAPDNGWLLLTINYTGTGYVDNNPDSSYMHLFITGANGTTAEFETFTYHEDYVQARVLDTFGGRLSVQLLTPNGWTQYNTNTYT